MGDFSWDSVTILKLRELWKLGLSTAEIGRRLGCSKNAVISGSRRHGCAPRGNPGGWKNRIAEKEVPIIAMLLAGNSNETISSTLRVCRSSVAKVRGADPTLPQTAQRRPAAPEVRKRKEASVPKFVAPRVQARGCCLYLIGDEKPWRQCDKPIERGSYCLEHYRRCHVVFPTKQEREAA